MSNAQCVVECSRDDNIHTKGYEYSTTNVLRQSSESDVGAYYYYYYYLDSEVIIIIGDSFLKFTLTLVVTLYLDSIKIVRV